MLAHVYTREWLQVYMWGCVGVVMNSLTGHTFGIPISKFLGTYRYKDLFGLLHLVYLSLNFSFVL